MSSSRLDAAEADMSDVNQSPSLRHGVISPGQALFFGLTGVGLPIALQGFAGNTAFSAGYQAWLAAVIAAMIALLLGWIVVRFSSRHLASGTLMSYVRLEVGSEAGTVTGAALFVGYIAALMMGAALAVIFIVSFLDGIGLQVKSSFAQIGIGLLLIAGCTYLAVRGVSVSVKVAIVLGWIGMPLIMMIVGAAIYQYGIHLGPQFSFADVTWGHLAAGVVIAFGQFTAFEGFTALAEETENPRKTIPKLVFILLAVLAVTILVSALATAPIMLANSDMLLEGMSPLFVLATAAKLPGLGTLTDALLALGTIGTTLVYINGSGRIAGTAAQDGLLPKSLAVISVTRGTPARATVFMGCVSGLGFAGFILIAREPIFTAFLGFFELLTYAWMLAYVLLAYAGVVSAVREKDLLFGVASTVAGLASASTIVISLAQSNVTGIHAVLPWVSMGLVVLLSLFGLNNARNSVVLADTEASS